jgi:hypothetical protein
VRRPPVPARPAAPAGPPRMPVINAPAQPRPRAHRSTKVSAYRGAPNQMAMSCEGDSAHVIVFVL